MMLHSACALSMLWKLHLGGPVAQTAAMLAGQEHVFGATLHYSHCHPMHAFECTESTHRVSALCCEADNEKIMLKTTVRCTGQTAQKTQAVLGKALGCNLLMIQPDSASITK